MSPERLHTRDGAVAKQAAAGQAVYTPRTLRLYDWLVLGVSNRWIWKCPTKALLALYDGNVSANHLDVGVGTGYFLDRCRFPSESPRVALLDMNAHCLQAAAARIERYKPTCYTANILQPLELKPQPFDSISLNYVLHCLPGSMREKFVAVRHLARLLNPGGVLFGATLLSGGVHRGWAARRLMSFYNSRGIFCNEHDDAEILEACLSTVFVSRTVRRIGCAALFEARLA